VSASTSIVRSRRGPSLLAPKVPPITDEMRAIHEAYCDGEEIRAIAKRIGRAQSWVWAIVERVHRSNKDARIAAAARGELP
jgi:Mor family transcriptional regulator